MGRKKVIKKKTEKDYKRPMPDSEHHLFSSIWQKILPRQTGERLAECANQRPCSAAWLIEEIINQWLKEHENEWKRSMRRDGGIASATVNVSVRTPLGPSTIDYQREHNTTASDAPKGSAKGIRNEASGNVGAHD